MKIECFINKHTTKILRNKNLSSPIRSEVVIKIYENTLILSEKIDTPKIIESIISYLNKYFLNLGNKDKNEVLPDIIFVFLDTELGIAKNGFLLNGLTLFIPNQYHILLSASAEQMQLNILVHELIHIYVDRLFCEKPISNIEELELEVEKHENIVLNEVSKWTES
ncbi:MAG: hypothetical protein ACTTHM_10000 [Peptoanaerobacter stomatis]|uniref:hypothetical protein n=1 Tax=Clostridia TaxID=186801 RepID=UPI003F9F12D2